jgi:predicted ABC-class ATPase
MHAWLRNTSRCLRHGGLLSVPFIVLCVAVCLQEALELGASVLLMDEDTCATNFMMRDARMSALVAPHKEPITPFSSRIA